jgi:hypothetical protein
LRTLEELQAVAAETCHLLVLQKLEVAEALFVVAVVWSTIIQDISAKAVLAILSQKERDKPNYST